MPKYIFIGELTDLKHPACELDTDSWIFEATEDELLSLEKRLHDTQKHYAIIEVGACISYTAEGSLLEAIKFLNNR